MALLFKDWLKERLGRDNSLKARRKELENFINRKRSKGNEPVNTATVSISQWLHDEKLPGPSSQEALIQFFNLTASEKETFQQSLAISRGASIASVLPNACRPVTEPQHFFGHGALIDEIAAGWNTTPPVHFLIRGKTQSGKTSLLNYLPKIQQGGYSLRHGQTRPALPSKANWIYVDFAHQKPLKNILAEILGDLNTSVSGVEDFLDKFQQKFFLKQDVATFILLNHIEYGLHVYDTRFWSGLRELAQGDKRVGFCVTIGEMYWQSHLSTGKNNEPTSFFSRFEMRELIGLNDQEARELLSQYAPKLTEEEIVWALKHSDGYPVALQSMCAAYLRAKADEQVNWRQYWLAWKSDAYHSLLSAPLQNTSRISLPSITLPVVADDFHGRQKILDDIRHCWRFPMQHIAIVGPKQSGKTSLLHYLRDRVHTLSESSLQPIYINFENSLSNTPDGFARLILRQCEIPGDNFEALQEQTQQGAVPRSVWLLDNLETGWRSPTLTEEFWWGIRAMSQDNGGNVGICTASRVAPINLPCTTGGPSPFANIFLHQSLGPFTQQEAFQFIQATPTWKETAISSFLWELTRGWPIILQAAKFAWLRDPEPSRWKNEIITLQEKYSWLY